LPASDSQEVSLPRFIRPALAALAGASVLLLVPSAAHAATVIVKLEPRAHAARAYADAPSIVGLGARVVHVHGDPAAAARRIARDPRVAYAEPNTRLHIDAATNDPLLAQQPDLFAIQAPAAWLAASLGGFPHAGGVPVGIVDSGIDSRHEDLRGRVAACASSIDGRIVGGRCIDDNDHGTHVAGTIGAIANNGVGIAGVSFASPLIVCKAMDARGGGSIADVANCIGWLHQHGAKVISMSLGGSASATLRAATRAAWADGGAHGSLLVAAAGNDSDSSVEYPAAYPEVVSVAAVDDRNRHASFSNANPDVEIAAPGVNVLSTRRGGGYVRFSGTSMATPHVAAVAALAWARHPGDTAATIRTRIDRAVTDLGAHGRDPQFGYGLISALLAVTRP
jgi:thermitase